MQHRQQETLDRAANRQGPGNRHLPNDIRSLDFRYTLRLIVGKLRVLEEAADETRLHGPVDDPIVRVPHIVPQELGLHRVARGFLFLPRAEELREIHQPRDEIRQRPGGGYRHEEAGGGHAEPLRGMWAAPRQPGDRAGGELLDPFAVLRRIGREEVEEAIALFPRVFVQRRIGGHELLSQFALAFPGFYRLR